MKPTTLQIPLDWRRSSAASFGSSTAMPAEYNQSVFFSLVLLGARGGWLAGQVSLLHVHVDLDLHSTDGTHMYHQEYTGTYM